jgi:Sigma-70 region 2/Sigma-70 factor, region 1.2
MNTEAQRLSNTTSTPRQLNGRGPKAAKPTPRFEPEPLPEWPGLSLNRPPSAAPLRRTGLSGLEAPAAKCRGSDCSRDDTEAAFTLYLREIGQVKPVTPQEELALVARIKQGDREARERLIKANLRRVAEISRQYQDLGLSLLDLISEGNVGLLKAVEKFEPSEDSSFATFSASWIKQSIRRALPG